MHNWIYILQFENVTRDLGLHLSEVMKKGFEYAINLCEKNGFNYNYLGNVDGDLILPPTFFENIICEFEKNPRIGVASGGTDNIIGEKIVRAKLSNDEPSGGHMLIRRKCFEEFGEFPISYALDSVIKAKARIRNWQTKRFENNIAIEVRDVSSAEGYWNGYLHGGNSAYYLNVNPLHVIVKSIKYVFKKPYYLWIAYLYGYFTGFIKHKRQIDDIEVRNYFWNKWKEFLKFGGSFE